MIFKNGKFTHESFISQEYKEIGVKQGLYQVSDDPEVALKLDEIIDTGKTVAPKKDQQLPPKKDGDREPPKVDPMTAGEGDVPEGQSDWEKAYQKLRARAGKIIESDVVFQGNVEKYKSDLQLEGQRIAGDYGLKGAQATAFANQYAADQQLAGAGLSAKAQVESSRLTSGAQVYGADLQFLQGVLQITVGEKARSEIRVEEQAQTALVQTLSDPSKEKTAATLTKRIIDKLEAAEQMVGSAVQAEGKDSKPVELFIPRYSSVGVSAVSFERQNGRMSTLSEFKFYAVDGAVISENRSKYGLDKDLINLDTSDPSKVFEVTMKMVNGKAVYFDKNCREINPANVFTKVDIRGIQGQMRKSRENLNSYFIPAHEADEIYFNQGLGDNAQDMMGYMGNRFGNRMVRREMSEVLGGLQLPWFLQLLMKAWAMISGAKREGIPTKGSDAGEKALPPEKCAEVKGVSAEVTAPLSTPAQILQNALTDGVLEPSEKQYLKGLKGDDLVKALAEVAKSSSLSGKVLDPKVLERFSAEYSVSLTDVLSPTDLNIPIEQRQASAAVAPAGK